MTFSKILGKYEPQFYLKLIILSFITFLGLYKTNSLASYPTGDGPEYVLTTEALYRHGSPDIRGKDSRLFKKAFTKRSSWENSYKSAFFDEFEGFLMKPNKKFRENFGGIYVAKNNKTYGYHFFSYSLLNVPARYCIGLLNKNPLACFKYTNIFLILLCCAIILFISPFNLLTSSLIAFSFFYSSVFWYIGWTHPEVFTACLLAIGLWLFFQNYNYIPLTLISIATTQNQPLLFLSILIAGIILYREKISVKTLIKLGLSTFVIAIPSIYYYYHFGTFNLIKDEGFLDTKYQTFTRIFGFFFDINQGMVLAIPLVLFLYLFFILSLSYKSIVNKKINAVDFSFPILLLALTSILVTMGNWNHGQAVINRYASWASVIVFIHFFFLIKDFSNIKKLVVCILVFITQISTTLYHETLNKFDWTWNQHKPIAEWVLKNYPSWYNPDPTIFGIRTTNGYNINPETSPIIFLGDNNEICKIMCLKDKLGELVYYGVPNESIGDFEKNKKILNDWVYIDKSDYKSNKSSEEVFQLINYKIAKTTVVPKIKAHLVWYEQVKEKAKSWNVSVDSALVIDALYILKINRENKTK